ncbi:hypothetical protein [Azotobacter chroococcum]|uniref:hypothetical protein n=1 Tax=Azotobacter chroococcum TaxID=353 RepID=UPI0010ADAABF|nr:hypothetical protein [Azotobacter chroococcum]TKD30013.1 hypothetical protein FCG41_24365 [Azotobacter chroococcum]
MASLALREQRAFSAGQWRWENMEPDAPAPDFLDTKEGQEWLRESAESLVQGLTVEGITHDQLVDKLDAEVIPGVDWNKNGKLLAILLADILKSDMHPLFSTANQFLGGTCDKKSQPLRDLAERMLTPKAAEYCQRTSEEDYD